MNIPSEETSFPFEVVIANGEKLCDCIRSPYCTCGEPLTFLEKVRRELGEWWYLLLYLGFVILISFFITIGVYLIFRSRHYDCPLKCAIKKSWPWRIVVFFVPILVSLVHLILNINYRNFSNP